MQIIDQSLSAPQSYVMVRNERMGGFVPSYDGSQTEGDGDFSFFDLVDMVNPLQHIPVLNMAYRALTGDEIKPISQIIGGAVFGGFAGATGGIVNTIIQAETGKDLGGHVTSLAFGGGRASVVASAVQEHIAYDDLPVSLLSFAQRPLPVLDKPV